MWCSWESQSTQRCNSAKACFPELLHHLLLRRSKALAPVVTSADVQTHSSHMERDWVPPGGDHKDALYRGLLYLLLTIYDRAICRINNSLVMTSKIIQQRVPGGLHPESPLIAQGMTNFQIVFSYRTNNTSPKYKWNLIYYNDFRPT